MSASRTAARLSVPTETPSFSARARARSSCCTVAKVDLGERSPFSRSALSRIPPIFPAPSTATLFPERSKPITLCPPCLFDCSQLYRFVVAGFLTTENASSDRLCLGRASQALEATARQKLAGLSL